MQDFHHNKTTIIRADLPLKLAKQLFKTCVVKEHFDKKYKFSMICLFDELVHLLEISVNIET